MTPLYHISLQPRYVNILCTLTSVPVWPGTSHTDSSDCCPHCCSDALKLWMNKNQVSSNQSNLTNTNADRSNWCGSYPKGPFQTQMHIWASGTAEGPLPSERWQEERRNIITPYSKVKFITISHIYIVSLTRISSSIWKTFFSSWGGAVSRWF